MLALSFYFCWYVFVFIQGLKITCFPNMISNIRYIVTTFHFTDTLSEERCKLFDILYDVVFIVEVYFNTRLVVVLSPFVKPTRFYVSTNEEIND